MKPHERRKHGMTTYYKLAYWDERTFCWHDTAPQYDSPGQAEAAASRLGPGRYRMSRVQDNKPREDLDEFTIDEGKLF